MRGVARGEFADGAAARHAGVIIGPAILTAVWKLVFDRIDPIHVDGMIEAHLDLALNGLRRRNTGTSAAAPPGTPGAAQGLDEPDPQ